jgi:AraC family transcriptional regulator
MERLANARIVMWEGGGLWIVEATPAATRQTQRTDAHAHHAIQVTISLGGRFRLDTPQGHVGGDAVAVAADASHLFEAEGLVALLFVEPESRLGRAVAREIFDGAALARVAEARIGDFRARAAAAYAAPVRDGAALEALGRDLVHRLAGAARADPPDLRVRRMIAWAAEHIEGPVSLADAAAVSALSPGRLRHLFVRETGLAFKTYLLWLRLVRAVERVAAGASLTEAAHDAGFADSAHFSRTFRRMFGVTPAALRMT